MSARVEDSPLVAWPPPPYFLFTGPAPGPLSVCEIELDDATLISGLLVEFECGASSVTVWAEGDPMPQKIAMARIAAIRPTAAVLCQIDVAATQGLGTRGSRVDHRRSFVLNRRHGSRVQGYTLGFIKDATGLFIYPTLDAGGDQVRCWFIPAPQIKDLQVGPPLGSTLIAQQSIEPKALAQALTTQATSRIDRIGQYLTDRALISQDALLRALSEQGKRPKVRLGDILVEAGAITAIQLDQALAIQSQQRSRRIGDILVEMGAVSVRLIQVALSDKLGIPYINVREFPVAISTLELVSTEFAIRYQVLPIVRTADALIVAVENPLAADFLQDLRFQTDMTVDCVIADPQDLKARIGKEYSGLDRRPPMSRAAGPDAGDSAPGLHNATMLVNVTDLTSQLARETKSAGRASKEIPADSRVSENTLVRLVNKIIIEARAQGASDIHIESNAGNLLTRIRFRKDGELEDYLELPQAYSNSVVSRLKIMAELDISERRHPQDGKIDFSKHGPLSIELRIAVIPTTNGLEDVVLRILSGAEAVPLAQVGFSDTDLTALKRLMSRTFGLILICGPTGSGKTTTLHSLLREINTPDLKIWTAEDPVEITQPGLRQVQVNSKIDWTFAAAMRAFLRADPDVIMVGEMRDQETCKIGIEASLTGHLVLSTLHTNSAAESIIRLLDLGMDPFNFADALVGVLSQRLTRKLCPSCKRTRPITEVELGDLAEEYCAATDLNVADVRTRWLRDFGTPHQMMLSEPTGCEACRQGYKGRLVVYELLQASANIKHLIRSKSALPQVVALAQQEGMISLRQHAIHHALRGNIDLASARAVAG